MSADVTSNNAAAAIFGARGHDDEIGNKARGLLLCAQLGISVPPWFVIPAETARLQPWRHDFETAQALLRHAAQVDGGAGHGWIVRSSTAIEDSDDSAHAGEFRTERADSPANLIPVVEAVAGTKSRPPYDEVAAGVIIQRYIPAAYAGVAFSCRPSGATPHELYCEFVSGRGELLVSGQVSPGSFSIGVRDGTVSSPEDQDVPSVLAGRAETLAEWILKLESQTGKLYDLEWVHDGTTLWCVQARPITSFRLDQRYLPSFCATSWFYDERFRAPVTPITRSTLMQSIFKAAVQDPVHMAGGSASPEDVFYYGGKPYVPHRLYRHMFAGIPRLLLTPYLRQLFPDRCACSGTRLPASQKISSLFRKLTILLSSPSQWIGNRRAWKQFKAELHKDIGSLRQLPAPTANWIDHWRLLDTWTERFLSIHRWSILLADASNAILLSCAALLPARYAASLNRGFTAGLNLPTAEANKALVALAREDNAARAVFVERFGHRSESLDHSQTRWSERFAQAGWSERSFFLNPLHLDASPGAQPRRLRIPILSELVEMREQQRFEWEKILALQHSMLIDMGAELSRINALQSRDDIWFLDWPELCDLLAGQHVIDKKEMDYRKHQYRIEKGTRAPQFLPEPHVEERFPPSAIVTGLGASSGRARGPVIVIRDSKDMYSTVKSGSVLVMSNMSPADTPVLLGVAALVLERGGLLSHAAIMAREYGIPLVTAAREATEVLKTGMNAVVDGDMGTVEFGWRNHDGH